MKKKSLTFEERVVRLVIKGKKDGFLKINEIQQELAADDWSEEKMDQIFSYFVNQLNIDIVDSETEDKEDILSKKVVNIRELTLKEKEEELEIEADDTVRMYLKQIGRYKLLKPEEEEILAKQIEAGSQDARKQFAQSNLRLVVSIAKRYRNRGVKFMDLVEEGNLGLMKAIDRFDWRKGYKFSTYATWWIQQAITRAIPDQSRLVRIPVHMYETINRVKKTNKELMQKLGYEPSLKQIADALDMKEEKVAEAYKVSAEAISIENYIGGDDEGSTLKEFIADDRPDPGSQTKELLLKEALEDVLESLTPQEALVIRLRTGLDDGQTKTLDQIGKIFKLTRERIRQLEERAKRKMRHPSRSQKLKDFLK